MSATSHNNRPGRRIVIIGSLPPPIGGVSSHVLRLARYLMNAGVPCMVLDLYPQTGKRSLGDWHRISPFGKRLYALIWACFQLRAGDTVHVHISRITGALVAVPLLLLAPGRRLVLTLHDGDQELNLSRTTAVARWLAHATLRRVSRIVALSEMQEAFYRAHGVPEERLIRWTGAPPVNEKPDDAELPEALRELQPIERGGDQVVLVTSGYLAPSYRFELALDLHRTLLKHAPSHLVLCFYGQPDDLAYAARIREAAASTPCVTVVDTLSPAAFLALLGRASLYLRPSLIDSYGLAIGEALDAGARALASDVCARDPRCVLFPTHDPDAFMRTGLAMAREGGEGVSTPTPASQAPGFIMDTYRFARG